jgi:hypothetical protein
MLQNGMHKDIEDEGDLRTTGDEQLKKNMARPQQCI